MEHTKYELWSDIHEPNFIDTIVKTRLLVSFLLLAICSIITVPILLARVIASNKNHLLILLLIGVVIIIYLEVNTFKLFKTKCIRMKLNKRITVSVYTKMNNTFTVPEGQFIVFIFSDGVILGNKEHEEETKVFMSHFMHFSDVTAYLEKCATRLE